MDPTLIEIAVPLVGSGAALGGCAYWWHKQDAAKKRRVQQLREQQERERQERAERERQAQERQRQFQRAREQEEQRRQELFKDTFELRLSDEDWHRTIGEGQVAGLFAGTFAARSLVRFGKSFHAASCPDHLGPLLLLELSKDERARCLRELPAYIRSRVVVADCELCPEGLTGADLAEAKERQEDWWFETEHAIRTWIARLEHDASVACLVGFVSPGGSAILAYPALAMFREAYRHAPVYLSTILDAKPQVRFRFPEVRQLLCENGLVTGTFVGCNTRDSRLHDVGQSLFYASAINAPWTDDQPSSLPNLGAHLFPKKCQCGKGAHKYATQSVYVASIPIYYEPEWENVLPYVYYTKRSRAVNTIQNCIRAVLERPALQSVPLEPVSERHTRDLYITTPIIPTHLKEIGDRVRENMKAYLAKHHPYVDLHFASIGVELTPTTIQAPVVAVLVQALEDKGEGLDALAQYRHTPAEKFVIHELRDIEIPERKAQLPPPEGENE